MHKKLEAKKDVVLVTVNCGEPRATLDAYLKSQGGEGMLTLHDEKGVLARAWGVAAYPSNFIIDETGVVRSAGNSEFDLDLLGDLIGDFEVRQSRKEAEKEKK
ncbi:MAG: redoxin domain-containing protein [Planctomycetes bacterium]|nr:redoxin domain-containing protein [Planctomycetota bacterium]